MLELMPKSWRSYDGKTQTWLDQVHDTIEGQEVRVFFRSLTLSRGHDRDSALTRLSCAQDFLEKLMIVRDDRHPSSSNMLCNYRYTAFKIKYAFEDPTYKGLDHDIFDELIAADPLGFLAYAHCCYYPTVEQKPEAEWYSDFQHRMLCFIGVFLYSRPSVVAILEDSAVRQRREHFKYTISQVQESARNGIQKFDPNLTRTILTQFPSMLKRIGA